jgi:predicted nuclease of predicted toxin-antitoxin system
MSQEAFHLVVVLYTDEDVSTQLAPALRMRGYRSQSTAEAGNLGIADEAQLTYAAAQNMAILTYNAQDFIPLARAWYFSGRQHAGIIISQQFSQRQFGELLRRVLRLLNRVAADRMRNQTVFLQQFK